jgi:hypothetical protein
MNQQRLQANRTGNAYQIEVHSGDLDHQPYIPLTEEEKQAIEALALELGLPTQQILIGPSGGGRGFSFGAEIIQIGAGIGSIISICTAGKWLWLSGKRLKPRKQPPLFNQEAIKAIAVYQLSQRFQNQGFSPTSIVCSYRAPDEPSLSHQDIYQVNLDGPDGWKYIAFLRATGEIVALHRYNESGQFETLPLQ